MSQNESKTTNAEEVLHELDGGVFIERIGRALSEVAAGTVNTDRKGSVTVTFNFKKITDHQVQIDHTVKYLVPKHRGKLTEENTTSTPMHVGANGRLTLFPETQPLLPLSSKVRTE